MTEHPQEELPIEGIAPAPKPKTTRRKKTAEDQNPAENPAQEAPPLASPRPRAPRKKKNDPSSETPSSETPAVPPQTNFAPPETLPSPPAPATALPDAKDTKTTAPKQPSASKKTSNQTPASSSQTEFDFTKPDPADNAPNLQKETPRRETPEEPLPRPATPRPIAETPPSPPATGTPSPEAQAGEKETETPKQPVQNERYPRTGQYRDPREHREHRHARRDRNGRRTRHHDNSQNRYQDDRSPNENRHGQNHPSGEQQPDTPPENYVPVFQEGIVEVSGKGFGFLRDAKQNFIQSNSDTFVTPEIVRQYNLRDGMWIKGEIRRGNRGPQLFKLSEIEGEDPEKYRNRPVFDELTTINPIEWIKLETVPDRHTTRVIDLMAPIGKGQRGLIVAPPRTGKTTLLQHIAEAVAAKHPEMKLMVLLVDERPEEVTELRRALPSAEVLASSNDCELKTHTRIAQLAIDRARRLVEMGKDVFLLLDSITRIGRAFNNAQTGKGRTMSGGVDTRALEIPRKIFASARNTEEAGSLTIIATALVETGSKMDDLIFLEFKGTGNMELVLDRKVSDQRIYPAADIFLSGTRREELLLPADALQKISTIRRGLSGHKPIEAIERLLFFLKKYPTNAEMLSDIPG